MRAMSGTLGASLTLIGIVIGYEVDLGRIGMAAPRLTVWVTLGLLFVMLVISRLFPGDTVALAAVMTMFVLLPPFVISLFLCRIDNYSHRL